jgi:hypothetical protein
MVFKYESVPSKIGFALRSGSYGMTENQLYDKAEKGWNDYPLEKAANFEVFYRSWINHNMA